MAYFSRLINFYIKLPSEIQPYSREMRCVLIFFLNWIGLNFTTLSLHTLRVLVVKNGLMQLGRRIRIRCMSSESDCICRKWRFRIRWPNFYVHVYKSVNTNQPIICLNHFVTNIKSNTKSNVSNSSSKLGTLKRSVSKKMDSVKTKIGSTTEKIPKIKKPKLPKILKRKKSSKTSEIPEVENPEYESPSHESTSPEPEVSEEPTGSDSK